MEIKTMTDVDHDLAKGLGGGGQFIRIELRVKDSTVMLLLGPCVVILLS